MTIWMTFCAWRARRHLDRRTIWLKRFDHAQAKFIASTELR